MRSVGGAPCNSPDCSSSIVWDTFGWSCCRLCCLQVPLIKLKCAEDPDLEYIQHTLFRQPFIGNDCNKTYLGMNPVTNADENIICKTCGGPQIRILKDWVSCVLEPVAVWLRMLKFDFYNDWVGGVLYFPLIKRKYKLKKKGRKFGQIKKDKFCQFNCAQIDSVKTKEARNNWWKSPTWTGIPTIYKESFQGNDAGYTVNRIRLEKPPYSAPLITDNSSGCKFTMESDITTHWYGSPSSTQAQDMLSATKEIQLKGKNDAEEGCVIKFTSFAALQTFMNGYPSITLHQEEKTETGIYGKPNYILTEDQFGQDSWLNIGGNALHKNICNQTYMLEREEYFKETLDCPSVYVKESYGTLSSSSSIDPPGSRDQSGNEGLTAPKAGGFIMAGKPADGFYGCIDQRGCEPDCGSNGVRACNLFCPCSSVTGTLGEWFGGLGPTYIPLPGVDEYKVLISHGLVTWFNHEIFYTPIVPPPQYDEAGNKINDGDDSFNSDEYKANIMLPTTIMELGSSTFCDIDDAPFIMNTLPPTTYGVSYESVKYKMDKISDEEYDILKFKDKEGSINLSAYVEFGCVATVCFNASATVNGSQIGVTPIDKNDIGIEIDTCFMRFIHEPEVREYFCNRFNGFKNELLDQHHMRPGSNVFENDYEVYEEMKLQESPQRTYTFTDSTPGQTYVSEYDDGDFFVPGDACGYHSYNKDWEVIGSITPDYFYGLAPGQTSGMINFPNPPGSNMAGIFGLQAHQDVGLGTGVDVISPDSPSNIPGVVTEGAGDNGLTNIKGIRFNRSQTPYYLYFGLVPGKTALHKTVGKFFADKINAVTLEGVGESDNAVSETVNNQNNINNNVTNPYSIYRTCLGQTVIPSDTTGGAGGTQSGSGTQTPGSGTQTPGSGTPGTGSNNPWSGVYQPNLCGGPAVKLLNSGLRELKDHQGLSYSTSSVEFEVCTTPVALKFTVYSGHETPTLVPGINKFMWSPAIMVGGLKIKGPNSYSVSTASDVQSSYNHNNLLITNNDMLILAQTASAPRLSIMKPPTTTVVDIVFNVPGTYVCDLSLEVVSTSYSFDGYAQLHNFGPYI